jgi:hypothetical protein
MICRTVSWKIGGEQNLIRTRDGADLHHHVRFQLVGQFRTL